MEEQKKQAHENRKKQQQQLDEQISDSKSQLAKAEAALQALKNELLSSA